jgi:uncharacterized membrane protein
MKAMKVKRFMALFIVCIFLLSNVAIAYEFNPQFKTPKKAKQYNPFGEQELPFYNTLPKEEKNAKKKAQKDVKKKESKKKKQKKEEKKEEKEEKEQKKEDKKN